MLDWLRERSEHARCSALLQQILEWTGKCNKAEMRSLAKAHGVTIKRHEQATHQNIREALRRHFKAAVAQEKGRLACLQLSASGGASEHSDSLARDSEHVLNSADVVDMRTLLLFRKQNKVDMPDHLQEAIKRIGGGYRTNKQNFRDVAELLGAVVQMLIQYPGGDKASRACRRATTESRQ